MRQNKLDDKNSQRINFYCVKKANLMHNLYLVYFVNLYMFRAYLGPSSGGTTVCIKHVEVDEIS